MAGDAAALAASFPRRPRRAIWRRPGNRPRRTSRGDDATRREERPLAACRLRDAARGRPEGPAPKGAGKSGGAGKHGGSHDSPKTGPPRAWKERPASSAVIGSAAEPMRAEAQAVPCRQSEERCLDGRYKKGSAVAGAQTARQGWWRFACLFVVGGRVRAPAYPYSAKSMEWVIWGSPRDITAGSQPERRLPGFLPGETPAAN